MFAETAPSNFKCGMKEGFLSVEDKYRKKRKKMKCFKINVRNAP